MILIVEDDAISRRALVSLLGASGYQAKAAASAEEAVQMVEEQGEVPSVALVDLNLPGMSGMDLIRRWEKVSPGITPVLITAAAPESVMRAQQGHSVSFMRKPIDFGRLLTVIGKA